MLEQRLLAVLWLLFLEFENETTMPTLEERVGHLEVSMAELRGQIRSDLKHIDDRFDALSVIISEIRAAITAVNVAVTNITVASATVSQKSTTNEKIIFAVIGTIVSAVTFVLGRLL